MPFDNEYTRDRWEVREWYTLAGWFNHARRDPVHPTNANYNETSQSNSFRGGTLQEAQTIQSWPAGLKMFADLTLNGLPEMPAPTTIKRARTWSTDGDEFDRDRFASGFPECWETRRRQPARGGNTITLTVDICAPGSLDASALVWTGITAARLVDTLENAGYRVQVDGLDAYGKADKATESRQLVSAFRVKDCGDPLDLDSLLLAIAHPFALRYFGFAATSRRPFTVADGFGAVRPAPEFLQGDIHIAKCHTRQDAIDQIGRALRKYTENALANHAA